MHPQVAIKSYTSNKLFNSNYLIIILNMSQYSKIRFIVIMYSGLPVRVVEGVLPAHPLRFLRLAKLISEQWISYPL